MLQKLLAGAAVAALVSAPLLAPGAAVAKGKEAQKGGGHSNHAVQDKGSSDNGAKNVHDKHKPPKKPKPPNWHRGHLHDDDGPAS